MRTALFMVLLLVAVGDPGYAQESSLRNVIVRAATAFTKAPYQFGGNTVRGLDCSSFVRKVYKIAGIDLPRTTKKQAADSQGQWADRGEPGDLVFFKNTSRRGISHVGIYIGQGNMVHASVGSGEVITASLTNSYFKKHFAGFRSFFDGNPVIVIDSGLGKEMTIENIILYELIKN